MFRTAIVGCGGMGNHHATILAKLPDVEVVAVCDRIEEKARRLAERIGTRWCTDYRTLLDGVDSLWVCTEPFNRLDIVTTAAAAGKHLFTEKPICVDLAEADAMIAATRKANVTFMLGYVLRFTQPFRLMRDALAAGELGGLVSCWTRRLMPFDTRGLWYGQQEKSGGVLFDFGSHDLDWMLWLAGLPKVVCARTLQVRAGARADEHGAAMLLFDGGAVGSCEVSWSSWLGESSVGLIGTKGSLVMGLDGKIRRKLGDGPEQVVDLEGVTAVDPTGATGKRAADGAIQEVAPRVETIQEHFFRCVATGAPPLPSAEAGRDVLRTVLALQESSRRGESVRLADVRDTRFRLSCAPAASPAAHERSAAR